MEGDGRDSCDEVTGCQTVMWFTELRRSGGEQIGRDDKEFQLKYTDAASCPGGGCGLPWACSWQERSGLETQTQGYPVTLQSDQH